MLKAAYMQRLADLFRNGTIMKRIIQPYEIHIPYLLQFMADYGLYGCGWVTCQAVTFRSPVPPAPTIDEDEDDESWNEDTIPEHLITTSSDRPRLSYCAIEIDIQSHHILNRETIQPRLLHHDFIERKNPVPPDEKLVHSMAELWRDEARRLARKGQRPQPTQFASFSHDRQAEVKGPWIHEEEMRAKLADTIRAERARSDHHVLDFDTFVKRTNFESLVQTALESVTDMFPADIAPKSSQHREELLGLNASSGHLRENSKEFPSADVDEGRITALLNEMESGGVNAWNQAEEYGSGEESAEEVDFDHDLLGRVQSLTAATKNEGAVEHGRNESVVSEVDSDVPNFSDDLDLDFDLGSPTNHTLAASRAEVTATDPPRYFVPNSEKSKVDHSDNSNEPFRLRGGASTPDRQASKRKRSQASQQPRKKPKALRIIEGNPKDFFTRTSQTGRSSSFGPHSSGIKSPRGSAQEPPAKRRAVLDIVESRPSQIPVATNEEMEIKETEEAVEGEEPMKEAASFSSFDVPEFLEYELPHKDENPVLQRDAEQLPPPLKPSSPPTIAPMVIPLEPLDLPLSQGSLRSSSDGDRIINTPRFRSSSESNNRKPQGHNSSISPIFPRRHFKPPKPQKPSRLIYRWHTFPPSTDAVLANLHSLGIPRVVPLAAYYSKDEDVPATTREYGGREFKLVSHSLPYLEPFNCGRQFSHSLLREPTRPTSQPLRGGKVWQFENKPPQNLKMTEGLLKPGVEVAGFSLWKYWLTISNSKSTQEGLAD